MTRIKTVQNDLDSHGLSWTDAVDLAQNRPLWRLLATSGAMLCCYMVVNDVRRTTGFSVTFLCKYLSLFLTRCCYTVNEFIYYVSRIYLLAYLLA